VRQVERHRDRGTSVGCEPLVGQIEVERALYPGIDDLLLEPGGTLGKGTVDCDGQVTEADVKESFVAGGGPVRRKRHC
jgi:hypothetical protein